MPFFLRGLCVEQERPALTLIKPGSKKRKASEAEGGDGEDGEDGEDDDEDESEEEDSALAEACELADEGLFELKEALKEAKAARAKIEKATKAAAKVANVDKAMLGGSGWRPFVTKLKKVEGEEACLKLATDLLDKWSAGMPAPKKSKKAK
eukprot:SAG22_NODE_2983_length_2052_cov_4.859191_1_plen_151_part_00